MFALYVSFIDVLSELATGRKGGNAVKSGGSWAPAKSFLPNSDLCLGEPGCRWLEPHDDATYVGEQGKKEMGLAPTG